MNKQVQKIADKADLIVNDFAFTKTNDLARVVNLNQPLEAMVIDGRDQIIETSMTDDIEINIVMNLYQQNKKYLTM